MKENLLHYIWKYKQFNAKNVLLTTGEKVQVYNSGTPNQNSGPDFLNAKIEIGKILWFGHVEIHVKSSDWYQHNHQNDINYDAVILHVVYEHDVDVFTEHNRTIHTLELKNYVDADFLNTYAKTFYENSRWIPCEKRINKVDTFILDNWIERLYLERLENKSEFILQLLEETNFDFEAVLFQLITKLFGLKVNGEAFLNLAKSINFSIIRKMGANEFQLSALLFGQAGFLETKEECNYHEKLKKEYVFLKHKYQLKPLDKNEFQFFRMRPNNFPTIRLAQVTMLYTKHKNLFSKLMELEKLEDFYEIFSIGVNAFWQTHYTFSKVSKRSKKRLTKSFIDLLLINVVIPLKFVFYKRRGELNEEELFALIQNIRSEKNTIITKFNKLKIESKNAMQTQALLELKNNYCNEKKCLRCSIGNYLLKS